MGNSKARPRDKGCHLADKSFQGSIEEAKKIGEKVHPKRVEKLALSKGEK